MGKTRNLNGIPESLAASYLSTLKYYRKGYMADWLNSVASKMKIYDIKIDLLNDSIHPKECQIKPLLAWNENLRDIIYKTLINNKFEPNFINRAELKFEIRSKKSIPNNIVNCYPELEDKNGKIYSLTEPYSEQAYERLFNPFKVTDPRYYK